MLCLYEINIFIFRSSPIRSSLCLLPRSEQDTGMGCPDSFSFGLFYKRLETEAELDTCHARIILFCIAVIIVIAIGIVIACRCHRSRHVP